MEEAIITMLLADSGVAAIVGTRVFPGARTQGQPLPALVINRISGAPIYASEGEVGLENARIQIDCWADTYTVTKRLARAVKAKLSAFHGTVTTAVSETIFQLIELETEQDSRESGANAADYPFRTRLDFICWART